MRVVIQRVSRAAVSVSGKPKSEIGPGVMILLGIEHADNEEDADWLVRKVCGLRIFPDESGVMNVSLTDSKGSALVVSQFTLHASYKKGNRPSYIRAARPEQAIPLYEYFVAQLTSALGKTVATGEFGGDMAVELVNEGPVTILMDSKAKE